jgi:hypothetical protein
MKTRLTLLAAVATLVVAPFVHAQTSSTAVSLPEPAVSAVSAENVALARGYFEAIGFQGQLGAILANLTTPEQLGARDDISSEEREAIVSSAAEAMDEAMPVMIDEAARITARAFTKAQLKDMIAFYKTDSGKAIAAKTAVPMATQLVMTFAPIIRADVMVRTCAKVDCAGNGGDVEPKVRA